MRDLSRSRSLHNYYDINNILSILHSRTAMSVLDLTFRRRSTRNVQTPQAPTPSGLILPRSITFSALSTAHHLRTRQNESFATNLLASFALACEKWIVVKNQSRIFTTAKAEAREVARNSESRLHRIQAYSSTLTHYIEALKKAKRCACSFELFSYVLTYCLAGLLKRESDDSSSQQVRSKRRRL
jgi:hypothetical protein